MTRQEAKKIMENEVRCVRNPNCERLECRNCYLVMPEHTVLKAYDVAIKALEQEPKTGHWIYQEGYVPYKWKCNQCSVEFKTDFNYCPNCGAKMESEEQA